MNQIFKSLPRHFKVTSSTSTFGLSRLLKTNSTASTSTSVITAPSSTATQGAVPQKTDQSSTKPEEKNIYKKKIELNLDSFILFCKETEKRSFSTVIDLQEKIETDLSDKEKAVNPQNRDLAELIAISCTDKEIDFLIDAVRRHAMKIMENGNPDRVMTYGRHLIHLLVSLEKTDKLIELIKDRVRFLIYFILING